MTEKVKDKKPVSSSTKTRFSALTIIMLIVLVVYSLSLIGLLVWGVSASLKPLFGKDVAYMYTKYKLIPKQVTFENYKVAFENIKVDIYRKVDANTQTRGTAGMSEMYYNSVLYSVGSALIATTVPCIVAYLCARFRYRFSNLIRTIVIVVMIVPIVGSLPSELQLARTLHLYDEIWGLWVMKANFLGMYFLVFYNVFRALPMAYTEAAKIDGAGNFAIMSRIILPLVRNTFLTVALINFINIWNDYQVPLKFMPDHPTVAYGFQVAAQMTAGNSGMDQVPRKMAAAVLVITPVFLLFIAFQKKLLGNLTMGGIKG